MDVIRILFSILLPPLGVFLQVGIGAQFWINILLTLCGYPRHHSRDLHHRHARLTCIADKKKAAFAAFFLLLTSESRSRHATRG
jgi:hypothetical protein